MSKLEGLVVPGQVLLCIALMVLTTPNGEHGLFMFFCSFSLILQCTRLKTPGFLASSSVLPAQQRAVMQVTLERSSPIQMPLQQEELGALGSSNEKVEAEARF